LKVRVSYSRVLVFSQYFCNRKIILIGEDLGDRGETSQATAAVYEIEGEVKK
jgi:hypothetical protein